MYFGKPQIATAIALTAMISAIACPSVMGKGFEPVKKQDWFHTLAASVDEPAFREADGADLNALVDFGEADSTFCAWVRTQKDGTIFAKMPVWGRDRGRSKLVFIRRGRFAMENMYSFYMESSKPINDGKWHHVAIVRKPSSENVAMFIDGQPDRTDEMRRDADNPGHFVRLGHGFDNYPEPSAFVGDLDEVRVYDRALGSDEIKSLFETPASALADGLLARWSFDGSASDASGKGLNIGELRSVTFVEGKVGQALHLDGAGWASAPVTPIQKLWYDVWGMFPDAASRQEMDWELTDGIWASLWNPGSSVEIARRYAGAYLAADADEARAIRDKAEEVKDQAGVDSIRQQYLVSKRRAQLVGQLDGCTPESLRKAIVALGQTGSLSSAQVKDYLTRLGVLERELTRLQSTTIAASPADESQVIDGFKKIQREALLRNRLFDFDKLVFIKRYTFTSNHYYTDYINGCSKYGGNICILDLKTGGVTELVPELKNGIFGHFDLSYDAKRIVFAWKEAAMKGFRIYEVGVDGKGLRQLTFPPDNEDELIRLYRVGYHHGTDDMDPCYLPDGGICFISTRCQYGILCDSPDDFTTTVLYRMDADGGNMEKLSNSSVSENTPCVTNDGRIMYTRWEYIDKGASAVKCLWAMRPDGSGSNEIYGNDINLPPSFINGRPIPGDNNQFVVVGAPHFPGNRVGTIIRLDTTKDIRTREPMTYITPVDIRGEGGWCDLINGEWVGTDRGPMYAEPYPLSASTFLVSYNPDKFWCDYTAYGLYLLDEFGNHVKIHTEPDISCWQPVPLKARSKPPVLKPGRRADLAEKNLALVMVTDIYQGMEGVKRGEIKYIRINEQMPRPWAARRRWDGDLCDQEHACISWKANLGLRVQHGVVPVEPDGSAYFYVPADRNVFLQALDKDYMEVQRERTYVNYRPGETRSCIGCHERASKASPASQQTPMALKRGPSMPGPQPGERSGKRPLYYAVDVQPVFDKHCVSCHSGDKPRANLNLSGEMTAQFNKSYEQIIEKGLIKNIPEIYPKCDNINYLPPKSLGSHASRLVQVLLKGHKNVKLSKEEMIRLTTWVDANGQYYGSYYGRRNLMYKDMPDFRPIPTFEEATSTECPPHLVTWITNEEKAKAQLKAAPAIITGSIRHPILITDHSGGGPASGGTKLRMFSAEGKVQWEYPTASDTHDIWVLPNGNILFTGAGAVTELTRNKQIVWQFKKDAYLTACQRLPNGNTLVGDNPENQLLEVDKSGKVVKSIKLSTACKDTAHQFRLARKLANGNYLAAHEGEGMVREYDPAGKVLKEFKVPATPYAVVRLKNGNTLVSCGEACQVIEFDPKGQVAWKLTSEDIAPIRLQWTAGVQRLPNGNTVITCWGGYSPTTPQAIEVTRSKKVVWTFSAPNLIGATNNIVLMDVPGDATKFEVLR